MVSMDTALDAKIQANYVKIEAVDTALAALKTEEQLRIGDRQTVAQDS